MKIKYLLPVILISALTACGGGGGSGATTGGVALFATDNLTQDYSEVWVTIYAVTTDDTTAQPVTLFNNTAGQVQNLRALAGIGALLDTQNLPAGNYDGFKLTLGNQINLVDASGTVTQAFFNAAAAADTQVTLDINATVTVTAGQTASVALDFDLSQFTYDPLTNQVTPVVAYKDPSQTSNLVRTYAEMEGSVVSIADASHFVMHPETGGKDINVAMHPTAVVFNESTNTAGADTSALAVGGNVEVYGNFTADTQTLEAIRLKIKDSDPSNDVQEIKGSITAVNGSVITVDINESDFMPASNTIDLDVASATFTKGNISMLDTGLAVEVKGAWDASGSNFLVTAVEIKGAPRSGDTLAGEYAEIKGTIQVSPNDGSLSLTVSEFEHITTIANGDVLSLAATDAWYEEGDASCLVDGANVEVKGVVDAGVLTASIIDVSCGGNTSSQPEASGTIASVDSATTLTLNTMEVGHFTMPANATTISVDFSTARFERGLAADLLVGAKIEIAGTWNDVDGIFTATELTFK